MINTMYGAESLYFEMNSDKTEPEARIYENIVGESATPGVEHASFRLMCSQGSGEKSQASAELENPSQSGTVVVRRMLFFMSAVAFVALVAATAALFLAAMKSPNDSSAKVQDFGSSRTIQSQDYDRIVKIAANITALVKETERIMKNLTTRLSSTQQELDVLKEQRFGQNLSGLRNIWKALNDTVEKTAVLTNKVNNISKMAGPSGPSGFNGSQGTAGLMGAMGPPGPMGAGNFSSCQYKVEAGDWTPGNPNTLASKTEPTGKRILGAACSTNFAAEYNLLSQQQASGKWKYVCTCKGTSTLFIPHIGETKNCYLHYWECPLTT